MLLVIHPWTIHLLNWKIGNEDACMFRRFSSSGFGNIPNGKVNKIRGFVARKLSKLCFVSCDDNWSEGSTLRKKRLRICYRRNIKALDKIFTWTTCHHFAVYISVKIRFFNVLSEKTFRPAKTIPGESWGSFQRLLTASIGSQYRRVKDSTGLSSKLSLTVFQSPAFSGMASIFWWSPRILW